MVISHSYVSLPEGNESRGVLMLSSSLFTVICGDLLTPSSSTKFKDAELVQGKLCGKPLHWMVNTRVSTGVTSNQSTISMDPSAPSAPSVPMLVSSPFPFFM